MVVGDLAGGVPVANMPGDAGQIAVPHREQRLGRRHHRDDAPVIKPEPFALTQRLCFRQFHKERLAPVADQPLSAQETCLVIQRYCVGGIASMNMGRDVLGQTHDSHLRT